MFKSFSSIERLKYLSNSFILPISALPPNLLFKKGKSLVVNVCELLKTLAMAFFFSSSVRYAEYKANSGSKLIND